MSTAVTPSDRSVLPSEVRRQVQCIQSSRLFTASDALRKLLDYLTEQFEKNPEQSIKETEVALAVFNRRSDFDPHTDSVVRVQTARLRGKLLEYYTTEGQRDELLIDIPKGGYRLVCSRRTTTPEKTSKPGRTLSWERYARFSWIGAAVAILAIGIALGIVIGHRSLSTPSAVDPDLAAFWRSILPGDTRPLAVFANPRLAGGLADGGLVYFDETIHAKDPSAENLGYTGVGDLMSIHALTRLFTKLGYELEPKQPSNVPWDGAKERNLIFVGRPEQNPAVREMPELEAFHFRYRTGIVNTHPRPGEQAVYGSGPRPNQYDHAVIALTPGLQPGRRILIFGGTLTFGTQAAVEFLCQPDSVRDLLARLGTKPGGRVPYFEALLYTQISKNIPLRSRLLIVRNRGFDLPPWSPPAADAR